MDKYPLIGVSICAVVLLVLGSLSNVVGYQSMKSSNQYIINEELNQKDLLFQTIVDIANNKEIQQIILKSRVSREGLFNPSIRFTIFNTPVLTKNQLRQMYFIGLILSKIISKSRMHLIIEKYQLINPKMQKEITAAIEKDVTLNGEITQLSSLKCNCEKGNTTRWSFPIICRLLFPLFAFALGIYLFHHGLYIFLLILHSIGLLLNCFWSGTPIPV